MCCESPSRFIRAPRAEVQAAAFGLLLLLLLLLRGPSCASQHRINTGNTWHSSRQGNVPQRLGSIFGDLWSLSASLCQRSGDRRGTTCFSAHQDCTPDAGTCQTSIRNPCKHVLANLRHDSGHKAFGSTATAYYHWMHYFYVVALIGHHL